MPVVTLPQGTTVDSPGVGEQLDAALAKVDAALPEARTASYASTHDRAFVSEDGRTAFALVYIPAKGGVDPGQAEARAAQDALAGVTVGRRAGRGDGARRPARLGRETRAAAPASLLGTLAGGAGRAARPRLRLPSFMALVPLLMALVAIPTTFLLVWPLASVTDVSVIVQFLVALVGLGDRDRLRAARRGPLARGTAAPARPNEQPSPRDGARRLRRRLQRHDRRDLAARARSRAGAVPAQHRHRRAADPARQRRRRDHAAAGRAGDDRAAARLAAHTGRDGPRQPRLVGLGAPRRAPPLGRRGRHRPPCSSRSSSPPRRSSSATRAPTRSPRRGRHAPASRSWRAPASAPARSRPSTRSSARATPSAVARRSREVEGVRSAA